jgi:hypothetical protein
MDRRCREERAIILLNSQTRRNTRNNLYNLFCSSGDDFLFACVCEVVFIWGKHMSTL